LAASDKSANEPDKSPATSLPAARRTFTPIDTSAALSLIALLSGNDGFRFLSTSVSAEIKGQWREADFVSCL
jgi:hypothetical protein